MTLLELAEAVIRVDGSKSEIVFEALPVDDPQVRQPDITARRQVLGWEPEVELDEGLKRLLASMVPGSAPAASPSSRSPPIFAEEPFASGSSWSLVGSRRSHPVGSARAKAAFVLDRVTVKTLPLANRYAEHRPRAATCCNAAVPARRLPTRSRP
jgi:hypothetical protein